MTFYLSIIKCTSIDGIFLLNDSDGNQGYWWLIFGGSKVTLVLAFAFLPHNFGKAVGTYECYSVSMYGQFEQQVDSQAVVIFKP